MRLNFSYESNKTPKQPDSDKRAITFYNHPSPPLDAISTPPKFFEDFGSFRTPTSRTTEHAFSQKQTPSNALLDEIELGIINAKSKAIVINENVIKQTAVIEDMNQTVPTTKVALEEHIPELKRIRKEKRMSCCFNVAIILLLVTFVIVFVNKLLKKLETNAIQQGQ